MEETTLGYLMKDGAYLMLLRNKKKNDPNEGKWLAPGGHLEEGETPEQCVIREVWEETGYTITRPSYRGCVHFTSELWEEQMMYVYTAEEFTGEQIECNEGTLAWIPTEKVLDLPLWEGDRIFLKRMLCGEQEFRLHLHYDKEDKLSFWEEMA